MSVSVVIPAHNRSSFVGDAIASAWAQTLQPLEVILIDDASADDTADVAAAAGARVIRRAMSEGSGPARNTGIEAARGEWIAFLDSDDTWAPDHLERLVAAAGDHAMVGAPGIDSDGRLRGNSTRAFLALTPRTLLTPINPVVTSGVLARRDAVLAVGGFRPLVRAQDLDLWLRLVERGSGACVGTPTVDYRVHPHQISADRPAGRPSFLAILDSYVDRPWMSRRLRAQALSSAVWDDLRAALGRRRLGEFARCAAWLGARPATWPTLLALFADRRRARDFVAG